MIARPLEDCNVKYRFCQNTVEYCGTWSSVVGNFFRVQKTDSLLLWDISWSITCITRIHICVFLHAGAFCILSNMVTRNEIVSIFAFTDKYLNQIMSFDRQKIQVVNCLSSIGRIFFGRPKISFAKFSSRPARKRVCDIVLASFRSACLKSIQNRARGDTQHVRYWRLIVISSKLQKFTLLVKEKGRNWFASIWWNRTRVYKLRLCRF